MKIFLKSKLFIIRKITFPDDNKVIINFLKRLLNKKPNKRICNLNDLKATELLKDFNFVF
jgi:hypothetical protein